MSMNSLFARVAAAALDKGMKKESARMMAAQILRIGIEGENLDSLRISFFPTW